MKNILLASKNAFLQTLIAKREFLIHRMCWKAFLFLNKNTDDTTKETYGFKSKRPPPRVKELGEFEDFVLHIVQRVEFKTKTHPNDLQKKLNKDVKEIREEKNIFIKANKTTNYYKTKPNDYETLVNKNVTKTYKKTNPEVPDMITLKDKIIAEKLELDDRIEASASRDSFITLKDHKQDFINNPTCTLINPRKSEIGIISKDILDRINKEITQATKVNLWKSTKDTTEGFKAIPAKEKRAFITFNVCDFYPSISQDLLQKALNYASRFTTVTPLPPRLPMDQEEHKRHIRCHHGLIRRSRNVRVDWKLLALIAPKFKNEVGLYRDDGLAICKATQKEIEELKQEVNQVFKSEGLKITIEANKKIVKILDVTFNLTDGSYKPYMKPNNKLSYVHQQY